MSRFNFRSIPIQIVTTDEQLAKVFKGMAVGNHGAITVAYRVPTKFTLHIGRMGDLMTHPIAVGAEDPITLNVEPLNK